MPRSSRPLRVQAKEGLSAGPRDHDSLSSRSRSISITFRPICRSRLKKKSFLPVVASAWRELVPNYTVREVFATKREEIRSEGCDVITQKLAADGIVVKEVMLRDIQLPPEYAKGLEDLLLKEQEERPDGCADRDSAEAGADFRT